MREMLHTSPHDECYAGEVTKALRDGVRVHIHQLRVEPAHYMHRSSNVIFFPPTVNKDDLGSSVLWGFADQAC